MNKPCEWRPSDASTNLVYAGCPAISADGDRYCTAHRRLIGGQIPEAPKINRREYQDADLLPLTDSELANLRELRERSK